MVETRSTSSNGSNAFGTAPGTAAQFPRSGNLETTCPFKVYVWIAASGRTGVVRFDGAEGQFEIGFKRGTPEHADSGRLEDDLGAFLISQGALKQAQFIEAQVVAEQFGGNLVNALIGMRVLDPGTVFGHIAARAQGILFRALGLRRGRFSFEEGAKLPEMATPLGDRWALLCEAARMLSGDDLRERLGGRYACPVLRSGGDIDIGQLRLSPQEMRAASYFDGVRPLKQVCELMPSEAGTILRVAFLLWNCDIVTFEGFSAAPAPEQATSGPPPRVQSSATRPPPTSPAEPPKLERRGPAPTPPPVVTRSSTSIPPPWSPTAGPAASTAGAAGGRAPSPPASPSQPRPPSAAAGPVAAVTVAAPRPAPAPAPVPAAPPTGARMPTPFPPPGPQQASRPAAAGAAAPAGPAAKPVSSVQPPPRPAAPANAPAAARPPAVAAPAPASASAGARPPVASTATTAAPTGVAAARPAPPAQPLAGARPVSAAGASATARPAAPAAASNGAPAARAATLRPGAPQAPAAKPPTTAATGAAPAAPVLTDAASIAREVQRLKKLVKGFEEKDLFEVLGVPSTATSAQIKTAYFQLAKALHPDTLPQGAPAELARLKADAFAAVNEAYRALGDDKRRAEYLEELKSGDDGSESVDASTIFAGEEAFQKGCILVRARKFAEAIAQLEKAIELVPKEGEYRAWRAWAKFLDARDKRAARNDVLTELEEAVALNPRCAQTFYFIGQVAKLTGDAVGAQRWFKRTVELDANHIDAQREIRMANKQVES